MEKYCLEWREYKENLSEFFRQEKGRDQFQDVTIISEDLEHFKAHRVILSAASGFFSDVLENIESSKPSLYIKGIKNQELKQLLDFIYEGKALIPQDNLESFLAAAQHIKVKGLDKKEDNKVRKEEVYGR